MNNPSVTSLAELLEVLRESRSLHSPTTHTFQLLQRLGETLFAGSTLHDTEPKSFDAKPFGEIVFPFVSMGAVSSVDLISSLNELIIYSFYWTNRDRYRKAADIGANIGLHTLLMSKLGWAVTSYEPDPVHLDLLKRTLTLNKLSKAKVVGAAVAEEAGTMELVRVLGNTTSTHLAGAKSSAYGELERIPVSVVDVRDVVKDVDFVKIDAEGKERDLIEALDGAALARIDIMVEVGTPENARGIFEHVHKLGINAFSQKIGWEPARSAADIPANYTEGSLFISKKEKMPWQA